MKHRMIPLNLQQFADGGDPAPAPQGNPQPAPTNPNPNPAPAPAPQGNNTEQLVQTLIAAIDNRQQRAEKSVLKSMAQQFVESSRKKKVLSFACFAPFPVV